MRTGDFSALSTPLMDPFTGKPYPGNKIPSGSACTSTADCINPVATNLLNNFFPRRIFTDRPVWSASQLLAADADAQQHKRLRCPHRSHSHGEAVAVRPLELETVDSQSLTDTSLTTENSFLPPDNDLEHNNNVIVSHNYAITNHLVNEARFGLSFYQFQVAFPDPGCHRNFDFGLAGLGYQRSPDHRRFSRFSISAMMSATIRRSAAIRTEPQNHKRSSSPTT